VSIINNYPLHKQDKR